jgi:hypothetical protein
LQSILTFSFWTFFLSILKKLGYFAQNNLICDHNEKLASNDQKNNYEFVTINFTFEIWDIFRLVNLLAIFGNIFHRKNRKNLTITNMNIFSIDKWTDVYSFYISKM